MSEVLPELGELNKVGFAAVVDEPVAQKAHLKRLMDERLPALGS